MIPHVLMSGPIRPSEQSVVDVVRSIRKQIPGCKIFVSTWTESDLVRSEVDIFQAVPEPTAAEILQRVTGRTRQQRELNLPDSLPGGIVSVYKMMLGVQNVCSLAAPYIRNTDKVIRIRTDSMFVFEPSYLTEMLAVSPDEYIAKKGDGFDWIAITSFSNLLKTWCFSSIAEYNREIELSWNPENLIARRVRVPVRFLDPSKVDMYIVRENGYKHYYP